MSCLRAPTSENSGYYAGEVSVEARKVEINSEDHTEHSFSAGPNRSTCVVTDCQAQYNTRTPSTSSYSSHVHAKTLPGANHQRSTRSNTAAEKTTAVKHIQCSLTYDPGKNEVHTNQNPKRESKRERRRKRLPIFHIARCASTPETTLSHLPPAWHQLRVSPNLLGCRCTRVSVIGSCRCGGCDKAPQTHTRVPTHFNHQKLSKDTHSSSRCRRSSSSSSTRAVVP